MDSLSFLRSFVSRSSHVSYLSNFKHFLVVNLDLIKLVSVLSVNLVSRAPVIPSLRVKMNTVSV